MIVVLPWLSDTGHLDLGSRKELEFHLDVGWGEGGSLVPSFLDAAAALSGRE